MRLFTVQPKEVFRQIFNEGYFICDKNKSEYMSTDKNFVKAYDWLAKEMCKKIGNKENIEYPVWAWYKINGKNELPDFNDILISYDNCMLLEIEIDDSEVVLSDYDDWHMPLNDCYLNTIEDDEEFEKEWDRYDSLPDSDKERVKLESWQKIFDVDDKEYVQATFWKLKKENIVSAHEILKSFELEDAVALADEESFTDDDRLMYGFTKENLPILLGNYCINALNRQKFVSKDCEGKSLEALILDNKVKLPEKDIKLIEKIEKLYDIKFDNKRFLNCNMDFDKEQMR